jgi:hypothetical protein
MFNGFDSNGIRQTVRGGMAALAIAGLLFGLTGGVAPPAAYALPGPGGADPCVPDPTANGNAAELVGTLRLLDAAVVGLDSRISLSGAKLQVPDPKCDGQFIQVPNFARTWSITGRPAGSTATLTQTTGFAPHLVPDRVGAWQVTFTACPSICHLTNPSMAIPPRRLKLDFNAVKGAEGRLSSDFLDSTLKLVLGDSRIQISQTGAGTTVAGNTSYIDFGPTAEQFGAPPLIPLPIDPPERSVPGYVRAIFLALQGPLAVVDGTDVDRVRLRANNVNLNLSRLGQWSATVAGGGINFGVAFDSNHPAIQCEAHYTIKTLFLVTLDEGWSDSLCPDFDLKQMNVSMTLYPTVANNALTVAGTQVTTNLVPGDDVRTDLVNFFTDATGDLESGITAKLQSKLGDPAVRSGVGAVLTEVLKRKFTDLDQVISVQVVGSDLVVRYTQKNPLTCFPGCVVGVAGAAPVAPVAVGR